jgi:hypothetical protein
VHGSAAIHTTGVDRRRPARRRDERRGGIGESVTSDRNLELFAVLAESPGAAG